MMDFMPDAHTLLTVVASVVSGSPVIVQFSIPVTATVLVITRSSYDYTFTVTL